jgi:hypothetical protein
MFSIILSQAVSYCSDLEAQAYNLHNQIYELEYAKQSIQTLSGMESVVRNINKQIERIEHEYKILNQMIQALNKTLLNYSKYEKRICDNCEQSILVYRRKKIDYNDFSGIRNIIKGI